MAKLRPLEPGQIEYVTNVVHVGRPYSAPDGFEADVHATVPCAGGEGVQVTWKRVGRSPAPRVDLGDGRRFCNALSPSRYNRCTLEPKHEARGHEQHDVWSERPPKDGPLATWQGDERGNFPAWCKKHEPELFSGEA